MPNIGVLVGFNFSWILHQISGLQKDAALALRSTAACRQLIALIALVDLHPQYWGCYSFLI